MIRSNKHHFISFYISPSIFLLKGAALVLALSFVSAQPLFAQDKASHAPLNIVPKNLVKAARFARRDVAFEKTTFTLPELVPGGAALKRPLRSVAALPGGRGLVQVGTLGNLEETDIGLTNGYGVDLWSASRMSTISRLLPRLPNTFETMQAKNIAVELLISRAAPPPGLDGGKNFFALRLERLLALGEVDVIAKFVDMTGADQRDVEVAITLAESRLAVGDIAGACGTLGALSRLETNETQSDFAVILRSLCQLKSGDIAAGSLTLDLARDAGVKDALSLDVLFSLTANVPVQRARPVAGNALSILQAVLLHEAKAPLFTEEVEKLPIVVLPVFAKNQYQTQETQLRLAERAVKTNKLSPEYLRDLMQMVELGIIPVDNPAVLVADVILRARQIRVLDEPVTPKGQMLALMDILSGALQDGHTKDWSLSVALVKPVLMNIEPSVELAALTTYAVPALVWLGEIDKAQAWVDVMLGIQNQLPSATSRNLQGLIRLTEQVDAPLLDEKTRIASLQIRPEDMLAVEGVAPAEAILMGAVLETGNAREQEYILSEIALLPLFGYSLPMFLDAKKDKIVEDKLLARSLDDMNASLSRGQAGDALIYGLIAISRQEQLGGYDMAAMARIFDMLQKLGLTLEARLLAKQILIKQAALLALG